MKKLTILFLFSIGFQSLAQNNFSIGTHIGLPISDTSNISSVNVGLNVSYLRNINSDFKLGASLGYSHFFIKRIGGDISYIPVAVKAQYTIPQTKIFLDGDLGYAISIHSAYKGGLYTFPKIGYKLGKGEVYLGLQTFNNKYKFDYHQPDGSITQSNENFTSGSMNLGYNFIF